MRVRIFSAPTVREKVRMSRDELRAALAARRNARRDYFRARIAAHKARKRGIV